MAPTWGQRNTVREIDATNIAKKDFDIAATFPTSAGVTDPKSYVGNEN